MNQTIIYDHDNPSRIDKFLAEHLSISRNLLQRVFDNGFVVVNRKQAKKSQILSRGDEMVYDIDIKRFDAEDIFAESTYIDLKILHEHDDYIVIYKPKGVLSHPKNLWDASSPSVASFLYHKYGKIETIGPFVRAGIVHRLDKDTDGLMICVLSERGLKYFRALFDARSDISDQDIVSIRSDKYEEGNLNKYYRALCNITPTGLSKLSTIHLPHFINKIVIPKIPQKKANKVGITQIISYDHGFDTNLFDNYNYDKVVAFDMKIWTGRTHQIRYHLSSEGWPIVGDFLYNKLSKKDQQLQLTAYRLKFTDPDGLVIDISI